MHITNYEQKQRLLTWGEEIRTIAQARGDTSTAKLIEQEIQDYRTGRFLLAVVGKFKRGKSTLCNALLGRKDDLLAPINAKAATGVISKFIHGQSEQCNVHFRDGRSESCTYAQIRDFVTEDGNKDNGKGVDCVEVVGPFAGLEEDLTLVDTPGAGSLHQHHDALLLGFLPQADAIIFLVTADQPIAEDEQELLRRLKASDVKKVFFAINKVDDPHTDEEAIAQGLERNRKLLASEKLDVGKIHRISALKAMRGELAQSGFPELLAEVSEFLAANKARVLQANFVSRISQVAGGLANGLAVEIESGSKSAEQLQAELATLQREREKLAGGRATIERAFENQWDDATSLFERNVNDAEAGVRTKLAKELQTTGALGVSDLARELPATVSRLVGDELAQATTPFEQAARASVERLRVDYPQIGLGAVRGDLVLRGGKESATLLKGTVAGLGTAAAGYGLAAAASSTAATIAAANVAAIAAAHTTVVAAGPLALAGNFISGLGGAWGLGGSILSWLGTGTATVSTAPVLAATPVWVAIAGPVGWILAGVGALAIPFAYRSAKLKQRDQMEEAALDHIKGLFRRIRSEQVPALRRMGTRILGDFRDRLDNELLQIERSLNAAMARKHSNTGTAELERLASRLDRLMQEAAGWA